MKLNNFAEIYLQTDISDSHGDKLEGDLLAVFDGNQLFKDHGQYT